MRSRPLPTVLSTTVVAGVLGLGLAACAGAPGGDATAVEEPSSAFPVEVTSCGFTATIEAAPRSAVTLNQGATEVVLALGLEDRLAGTAYLDDAVPEKWAAAYESVPVLSKEYPNREEFLAAEPDLAYASYGSAFDAKVAGTRQELAGQGVATYLSPFGCEDDADRPQPSFEAVWDELASVAAAFGEPGAADELVAAQQDQLAELAEEADGAGVSVLWYDGGRKAPFVGAGGGGPQLVLDAIGAENVFADVDGGWAEVSWEDVIAADPEVIVLADASWDTADDKLDHLREDPVLSQLTAVREERFVTVPFSESTPGVRLVDGAVSVGGQIEALDLP